MVSSTVGSSTHDRLESALECGVFFDVLAVLVERRCADAVQFTACQHRLEHVGCVHRAVSLARADDGVHFVDEQNDLAVRGFDLFSTAFSRSSNSPRYLAPAISAPISSDRRRLVLEPSGTSPRTMRCARPSTMAVLPTPGSPISTGLFLVRRREHLDDAADLFVSTDDRIDLALGSELGEVARVALERVIGLLGGSGVGSAALAQIVDGSVERLRRDAQRRRGSWRPPASAMASACSTRSTVTKLSPALVAICCA